MFFIKIKLRKIKYVFNLFYQPIFLKGSFYFLKMFWKKYFKNMTVFFDVQKENIFKTRIISENKK